nr:zinc-dependent metalloprotease family protein [uncultured Flavobacterium sp.]
MKKALLFVLVIFNFTQLQAQNNELWQRVGGSVATAKGQSDTDDRKLYYKLNDTFLKEKLAATFALTDDKITTVVTFPNAHGVLERFMVWEASNFAPELQAKYPDIRAYAGVGIDDKNAKINFSMSPLGLQTMVIRATENNEFIENNIADQSQYVVFTSKDTNFSKSALICSTVDSFNSIAKKTSTAKTTANNKVFKTLRLALSCTGEYAQYYGGTKAGALAGMNATMTRVNGIFNKDLALNLILIANNDAVIFTTASSDPYSNASSGANGAWNNEVQTTLTNFIGNSAYDIGHLFGGSGGGGNSGCIGCVCVDPTASFPNAKGSAYTSPSDAKPQGDTFDIDYVAHEMGHQLGGNHTFSFDGSERTDVNVEPGSGSTIMAYAGITDDYDVQGASDDYFAYASILQIQDNLATKSCPVSTSIANNPPVINAGADYTIPKETAFVLTGTGTDPEGDTITYCWEQNDSATTTSADNSRTYLTKPDGPMFRSFAPTNSPVRYMPSLSSVVQNRLSTPWESVSSIAKTMRFTLTGRDNAAQGTAQTNTDLMLVTVNPSTGPFAVTSQNTDNISWANSSQQLVTWAVNNTTTLAGSSSVNIKLSTDGGLTFSTVLASNTPNDGSEVITVPEDVKATNCRVLIEPTANIYYAVNGKPFSVGYTSVTNCNSYSFGNSFSIPNSNNFTVRTITVPASAQKISDVNVSVNVTHASLSDLEFQMVSPQGTVVKLLYKTCAASTNQNFLMQFDDSGTALDCSVATFQTVLPFESLGAFTGENLQGTWTFRVRDLVSGTSGTINAVSLNICDQTYTLGTKEIDNINFVLYPNPNKGNFTVQFSSDSINEVKIFVHDILGKKLYEKTFERTSVFSQEIQMPITNAGVYLVTVLEGEKKTVKKIIIN